MNELNVLRERLGDLDQQLLALVASRQELSKQIGLRKQKAGLPTRDYQQEKEVVQRAVAKADELGLSSKLAERLMVLLIEGSLTVQEKDLLVRHSGGIGKRVLVIGGAGKMGGWMARFLASQGFDVEIADPRPGPSSFARWSDWKETALDHDVIVVATPLGTTAQVLLELAQSPPPGLILDIGSLKSPLRGALKALVEAGARVTSIHPMFGPSTELLSHQHVIFVDVGNPEATRDARQLFSSTMALHVETDLESHDRLIAYVLGLSHAVNIAFFTALAESGETAPRLAQLSSTTFDAMLDVASEVAHDSPQLYFEIQCLNDYGTESLSALLYAVEKIRSVVRAGDEQGFAALMLKGREYLEGAESARFYESGVSRKV